MSYRATLPVDYKLLVQYAPQTTIDEAASGAYALAGYTATITPDYTAQHQDDPIFGNYDLHSSVHTGRLDRITLNYAPTGMDIVKRGMILPGGAGTVEEPLTLIESTLINNVQMYRLHVGCVLTSQSAQINRTQFRINHTYEVHEVSDWVTDHGLTTYDFVTYSEIPTDPSLSHLSPGEDPCEIDSVVRDVNDFRWDINWPLARLEPNGYFSFKDARQSARRIGVSLTSFLKDNVLKNYVKNYSEIDVSYRIKGDGAAAGTFELLFNRCKFDRYSQSQSAGGNAFATETISGSCYGGITVTEIT